MALIKGTKSGQFSQTFKPAYTEYYAELVAEFKIRQKRIISKYGVTNPLNKQV